MNRNKKNTTIALHANLDIAHATALLADAKEWLGTPSLLQLDASKVERVSTATLQILLTLCTGRKISGLSTQLCAPSEALCLAVKDLRLSPHFEEYLHD